MSTLPSLGPRGEGWLALQLILIVAVAFAGPLLPGDVRGDANTAFQVAGIIVSVAGLLMIYRGYLDLGRSFSPLPHPIEHGTLVHRGIYSRLRHPIYSGLVLAAVGWAISHASVVALVLSIVLAVVLILKSRREEAWLVEQYLDYAAYAARTRRFIPGVY